MYTYTYSNMTPPFYSKFKINSNNSKKKNHAKTRKNSLSTLELS